MKKEKLTANATSYHHGDLRQALLDSAEVIIKRDGLHSLTLRGCAREAGVSHAGPAHHFPNLMALTSELAAVGYQRLISSLHDAFSEGKADARSAGRAYVMFAKQNPEMFLLMCDMSRLDGNNPVLFKARRDGLLALAATGAVPVSMPTLQQLGAITSNLSVVFGFSMLMLTGRLGQILEIAPSGTTELDLLEAVLSFHSMEISKHRSSKNRKATAD